MSTVYVVKGSEDGLIGLYRSATKAIDKASRYVMDEMHRPVIMAFVHDEDRHTTIVSKTVAARLARSGNIIFIHAQHVDIEDDSDVNGYSWVTADVTLWEVE